MQKSGTTSDIVFKNITRESRRMRLLYSCSLLYVTLSLLLLGVITSGQESSDSSVVALTRIQIYSSLLFVVAGLWAKHRNSLLVENNKDMSTIKFYDDVYSKKDLAASIDSELSQQDRKITVLEAMKYDRLVRR